MEVQVVVKHVRHEIIVQSDLQLKQHVQHYEQIIHIQQQTLHQQQHVIWM